VKFVSLPNAKGKRDAQQECARLVTEFSKGDYVEPDQATLAQFLERWLIHIRTQVSPRTHERYAEIVRNNIVPALGAAQLVRLRVEDISTAYGNALKSGRRDGGGGLSPRTVHHMHRILSQALTQARVWRMIADNPADLVKPPKVERKEMKTIDTDQTVDLLEAARGTSMFAPILLGVLCGMRRGEVVALRWRSVDLENGQLSIVASAEQTDEGVREKETKSGKGRAVELSPMLVSELRQYRKQQAERLLRLGVRLTDDHHVVMREDGEAIQPRSLSRAFRKFMRRHKLPQIRLHDLRHSHATQLLAEGVHPKIAQERLGHSSISITLDLYSHVLPGMQAEAVAKVDAKLQAAMNKRDSGKK
ncbi:MAG: tyrosine-type recombinase/integrase, partial [Xanthobacteraceae bacterium]